MTFKAGTGLMGCTAPGQEVTADNVKELPPGSVVRLHERGRIIHLHDDLWLWCNGCTHQYGSVDLMKRRLPGVLCHMPNASIQAEERSDDRLK